MKIRALGSTGPRVSAIGLAALELGLIPIDLAEIERAVPPGSAAGDRYDAHSMKLLDSERAS